MKNIAVIGAGTMGNGIAQVFAQFGHTVSLIDNSREALDKGLATLSKNLDRMIVIKKISEIDKAKTLNNIVGFTDLKKGVKSAQLVVEAATEDPAVKLKIFISCF